MKVRYHSHIAEIPQQDWELLNSDGNPFTSYHFLKTLELSHCVNEQTGWQPQHLAVYQVQEKSKKDLLLAVLPLYIKTHSYGEYVFDWAWARAYRYHGLAYYPKLLTAIPFTPVDGQRLLIRDGYLHKKDEIDQFVYGSIREKMKRVNASSWHILFPKNNVGILAKDGPLIERLACQFHWFNKNYRDFDHYLSTMTSRKRKMVKRERRLVKEQGLKVQCFEGCEIKQEHWQYFYTFYTATYLKRGQSPYLSLDFFLELSTCMPDKMVMVMASSSGSFVAAALYFRDEQRLYGRYWGCLKAYDCLHFELCYYQGIEYCIKFGLQHFNPGTQGEHKIPRGFMPVITRSYHFIEHEGFRQAVWDFSRDEALSIKQYLMNAKKLLPFKND